MDISKIIRKNRKFIEPKEKPEVSTDSKATMTDIIVQFIKDNPDCKLSDMYHNFPNWDQAHIRTKIRRLVEIHKITQRFRVEGDFTFDQLNFN